MFLSERNLVILTFDAINELTEATLKSIERRFLKVLLKVNFVSLLWTKLICASWYFSANQNILPTEILILAIGNVHSSILSKIREYLIQRFDNIKESFGSYVSKQSS